MQENPGSHGQVSNLCSVQLGASYLIEIVRLPQPMNQYLYQVDPLAGYNGGAPLSLASLGPAPQLWFDAKRSRLQGTTQ